MFGTLGLIFMIWWCMMLFHLLHADFQCMGSEAKESPITNVKMNWRKMELSWESTKNFSEYTCTIMDKEMESIEEEVNTTLCRFPVEQYLPLHEGVDFIIEVPNTNISKICTFIPGGNSYGLGEVFSTCTLLRVNINLENNSLHGVNGSAIENFSCVIYNISFMNCTWQAGRDAPGDTQYFLYWQNSRYDDAMECELYIKDENGRNIGCRFQNVRIKTQKAYFLVNGSSKDSVIQFYDEYIELYEIEILTPPLNVTVDCSGNSVSCIVTWQPPLTSHGEKKNCFQYEIAIQNKVEPKEEKNDPPVRTDTVQGIFCTVNPCRGCKVTTERYEFQNYNEKKKFILKIRASGNNCLVSSSWGEWSQPIEIGQGKDYFIFVIFFLIALGTISVTLLQYYLFRRYCSFKNIFSPIPQPRDKLNASTDEDIQTEIVDLPKKSCTEEVTMVEDIEIT